MKQIKRSKKPSILILLVGLPMCILSCNGDQTETSKASETNIANQITKAPVSDTVLSGGEMQYDQESNSENASNTNYSEVENTETFFLNLKMEEYIKYDEDYKPIVTFEIKNESSFNISSLKIRLNKCPDEKKRPTTGNNCDEYFSLKGPFKAKSTTSRTQKMNFEGNAVFRIDKVLTESGSLFQMPRLY